MTARPSTRSISEEELALATGVLERGGVEEIVKVFPATPIVGRVAFAVGLRKDAILFWPRNYAGSRFCLHSLPARTADAP